VLALRAPLRELLIADRDRAVVIVNRKLMSVLGGMSESERQHVQARVRAAMDAQVVNEGRHQGGRPTATLWSTAARTRTPRKAAEGHRLRPNSCAGCSRTFPRRARASATA